jgi:TatA/E family protein of Tat protein translocase
MACGNDSTIICVFELTIMVLGFIGTQTLIIVMVIALLVFGPAKLPEIGRQIGQAMRELKKMSGDMTKALDLEQHVSMDTNYNYGSYSNYTDSSTYQEPMDQHGLSDTHAYSPDAELLLEPAPPSKTLEITGKLYADDGTLIADGPDAESDVVALDVVTDGSDMGGITDVQPDGTVETVVEVANEESPPFVVSPGNEAGDSAIDVGTVDVEDSPAITSEGRAGSTSDEVA